MPILSKAGASFTPAPAGAHASVCVDVVDLGIIEIEYQGKKKKQHKIKIVWQIEECREDGSRFTVQRRYTNSLHEKATLRRDLESWRGRPFNETELSGFDLENLLGAGALLNIIHEARNGSTYANVASIMRIPKSMAAPVPQSYVREIHRPKDQQHSGAPEGDWGNPSDEEVPF